MKKGAIFGSWLSFGILLTALYGICLTVILLTRTNDCKTDPIGLTCLDLNSLGDFFAGVFAPLAFIWLVVAVLIQASELNAQREELKLTRQEMKDSRNVLNAQADEARKQAEFIGAQTRLMIQKVYDESFMTSLSSLSNWVVNNFHNMHVELLTQGQAPNRMSLRVAKATHQEVLTEICRLLTAIQDKISVSVNITCSAGKVPLDQLRDRLETLLMFQDQLSPVMITLIAETQLKKGVKAAKAIVAAMP